MQARGGERQERDDVTWRELRHLILVTSIVVFSIASTYLLPFLARDRPFKAGDALPLASLWKSWQGQKENGGLAGVGEGYRSAPNEKEQEALGSAVRESLKEVQEAEQTPREDEPSEKSAGEGDSQVRVDAREYEGIEHRIEDPSGEGMRPFFLQLARTAGGKAELTRVAHYGDSSIATDLMTFTMRRRLQARFGEGGHGFVLIAKGFMPYRHRDIVHQASTNWSVKPIMYGLSPDGRYGYGGVHYVSRSGAWASFATESDAPVGKRITSFELFFQEDPQGGDIAIRVDGGEATIVQTRGEKGKEGYAKIDLSEGPHRIEIRHAGGGASHLYGAVLEKAGAGVVYDSIGLVGARAVRLLNYDGAHIARQLEHRGVHLLVLGFGGNEAGDPLRGVEAYEEDYRKVIRKMRRSKEMGCLLFAPLDQARRDESGKISTMPSVPRIVAAQRRAALAEGCAFFNTFEAMGGEGAMRRWYASRLAMGDFRHATPAGYEVIASLFYKAILQSFADHLAKPPS